MNILGFLQRPGRALQLPIAALPVTTLLLRFGQPGLLSVPFIVQAGEATFDSLVLIFAIGVASGWSKDNAGSAASTGAVGYFVMTKVIVTINPEISMGMLAGIIIGLVVGAVYNHWAGIKLPDFLSFFGSKRFVPIATGLFCLVLAAIFGCVWPPAQHAIHSDGEWIVSAEALGSGIFGFINRLLIPTGLHQVLNTIVWFQIDEFTNAAGTAFRGGINRFYVGDGIAGMFMSGFFPIMMFGLPGAALAMYLMAPRTRRPVVSGMLLPVAITTFLTGVTEPLEFLFMFLAPLLYLLHAVLTDISLFIATTLGIYTGFSFPADAIDYVLMYSLPATNENVWMLLMMDVVSFFVYFLLFNTVIHMFNLRTPGREDGTAGVITEEASSNARKGLTQLATSYVTAVDETDNLEAIDACITRLRLTVGDSAKVDDAICKRFGVSGVVKLNKQTIQAIVGAKARSIGGEMKKMVTRGSVAAAVAAPADNVATAAPTAKSQAVANAETVESLASPVTSDVVALEQVPDETFANKAVGGGTAVRPTSNIIIAPAAGTVVKIFNINHAFCLKTDNDTKIVVHMGIDAVALEGKGFKRSVGEDTDVKVGEPILEVDPDFLNANAYPVISPIAYSNSDDYSVLVIPANGKVVAGQTPLYGIGDK